MSALFGVDYYGPETPIQPNFKTAYAGGIRFAIVKAINGRPIKGGTKEPARDPAWDRDKDAILAANLVRGAYLFLCYPRKGFYTPEPEAQAQAFVDYVKLTPYDLPPWFDVEETSDVLTPAQMYDWTLRCATALGLAYKTPAGMYTSKRVWTENLGDHAAGGLLSCPLWLAKPWPWPVRAPANFGALPDKPTLIPQWGSQWFVYQRQGDALKVPGFPTTADVNLWNVLAQGAKSDAVAWCQRRLKTAVDPKIVVDGDFGPMTKAAVEIFQTDKKLAADGVLGPRTWAALAWYPPTA